MSSPSPFSFLPSSLSLIKSWFLDIFKTDIHFIMMYFIFQLHGRIKERRVYFETISLLFWRAIYGQFKSRSFFFSFEIYQDELWPIFSDIPDKLSFPTTDLHVRSERKTFFHFILIIWFITNGCLLIFQRRVRACVWLQFALSIQSYFKIFGNTMEVCLKMKVLFLLSL